MAGTTGAVPTALIIALRAGDAQARLADFGLARVAKQRAGTDATVASVSAVCGTAAFLDPI